jgi:hypothetical protein
VPPETKNKSDATQKIDGGMLLEDLADMGRVVGAWDREIAVSWPTAKRSAATDGTKPS